MFFIHFISGVLIHGNDTNAVLLDVLMWYYLHCCVMFCHVASFVGGATILVLVGL